MGYVFANRGRAVPAVQLFLDHGPRGKQATSCTVPGKYNRLCETRILGDAGAGSSILLTPPLPKDDADTTNQLCIPHIKEWPGWIERVSVSPLHTLRTHPFPRVPLAAPRGFSSGSVRRVGRWTRRVYRGRGRKCLRHAPNLDVCRHQGTDAMAGLAWRAAHRCNPQVVQVPPTYLPLIEHLVVEAGQEEPWRPMLCSDQVPRVCFRVGGWRDGWDAMDPIAFGCLPLPPPPPCSTAGQSSFWRLEAGRQADQETPESPQVPSGPASQPPPRLGDLG